MADPYPIPNSPPVSVSIPAYRVATYVVCTCMKGGILYIWQVALETAVLAATGKPFFIVPQVRVFIREQTSSFLHKVLSLLVHCSVYTISVC